MRDLEHQEQSALFRWASLAQRKHPQLANLFAVPNGGHRDIRTASRLKAEGVRAGVPDLFLAWPAGAYHGLWIEMKAGKNKPTGAQLDWHMRLSASGYLVCVCYGWDEAREAIERYLKEAA